MLTGTSPVKRLPVAQSRSFTRWQHAIYSLHADAPSSQLFRDAAGPVLTIGLELAHQSSCTLPLPAFSTIMRVAAAAHAPLAPFSCGMGVLRQDPADAVSAALDPIKVSLQNGCQSQQGNCGSSRHDGSSDGDAPRSPPASEHTRVTSHTSSR